jgi:hypothetical protein
VTDDQSERAEKWSHEQNVADETGFSVVQFESSWWGNEKLGEWSELAWAVVDAETDDAYHLAVADTGSSRGLERLGRGNKTFDVWVPKDKTEIVVEPTMTCFTPDDAPKGEVMVVGLTMTEYGRKLCVWGDTYEALSEGNDALLADCWDDLHAVYTGDGYWTVDVADGRFISKLTDGGYTVKLSDTAMGF